MNVISWLQSHDPTIKRLTHIKLFGETHSYDSSGLIDRYLSYYHKDLKRFEGYYTPKWTSSFYVLLELIDLDIDPKHSIFVEALIALKNHIWFNFGQVNRYRHQDLCVVGMLLKMCCYAEFNDEDIYEMIDYLLSHQMPDGGYNCQYETKETQKSSVHTTLTLLEAFHMYRSKGYTYRLNEVNRQSVCAEALLIKRHLYKSFKTGQAIHEQMLEPHYPPRWKYDILRALEYFSMTKHTYQHEFEDALMHLIHLKNGSFMKKGKTIPGDTYFVLETERMGQMNTLRMLYVFKHFKPDLYESLVHANDD